MKKAICTKNEVLNLIQSLLNSRRSNTILCISSDIRNVALARSIYFVSRERTVGFEVLIDDWTDTLSLSA
jgi:hypothetical protein